MSTVFKAIHLICDYLKTTLNYTTQKPIFYFQYSLLNYLKVSNENNTEGDINQMGLNLSNEVSEFIKKWCPGNLLGRISFVCHSLGGLIVRAALPFLNEWADKMFTYITLGTPHIGYPNSTSLLVSIGMFLMRLWKSSTCLNQLNFKDDNIISETCLYKLSQSPVIFLKNNNQGLTWFENILLISSL